MKTQQKGFPHSKWQMSLCIWLAVLGAFLLPVCGFAQDVTMTNAGSSATIDLGSSAGMDNWSVGENGLMQNQLNQQWFWYSINGGPVQSIDAIGNMTYSLNNTGPYSELSATYTGSQISVNVDYQLTGGGVDSGNANLIESLTIVNNSSTAFNLAFFQYSYFSLLESPNLINIQQAQPSGLYTSVSQTTVGGANGIVEVIDQPNANYAEAGDPGTVLTDVETQGKNLNGTTSAGPGNVGWAFEWAASVDPGLANAFTINKDKNLSIQLVPEPSTIALGALGIGAFAWARRRSS